MEHQETTSTTAQGQTAGADAPRERRIDQLGHKLKIRFAEVKAQLDLSQAKAKARERIASTRIGGRVRGALQQAVGRVKIGLDLPSRSELESLAQRIEEVASKLADHKSRTTPKKKTTNGEPAE